MKEIPSLFKHFVNQILYIAGAPVFFIAFAIVYRPEGLISYFGGADEHLLSFNLAISAAIILVTILIGRLLLALLGRRIRFDWPKYMFWCFIEIAVCGLFLALFFSLMLKVNYFIALKKCMAIAFAVLIFPYVIITLALSESSASQAAAQQPEDGALVRFYDEFKKPRLMIASQAILYIEAEENYVKIHYLDGDRLKNYVLRNSMKGIEETVTRHGLVRCQRSYYINPAHIALLRKNDNGTFSAELDAKDVRPIPVSKQYYDAIMHSRC